MEIEQNEAYYEDEQTLGVHPYSISKMNRTEKMELIYDFTATTTKTNLKKLLRAFQL